MGGAAPCPNDHNSGPGSMWTMIPGPGSMWTMIPGPGSMWAMCPLGLAPMWVCRQALFLGSTAPDLAEREQRRIAQRVRRVDPLLALRRLRACACALESRLGICSVDLR